MNEEESVKMTPLDRMVSRDSLQLLKAAIPYTNPNLRSMLSIFAKTLELRETIHQFSGTQELSMMSSAESAQTGPVEMLQDLGQYLSGEMKENLNSAMTAVSAVQMFQMYQEDGFLQKENQQEEKVYDGLDE